MNPYCDICGYAMQVCVICGVQFECECTPCDCRKKNNETQNLEFKEPQNDKK